MGATYFFRIGFSIALMMDAVKHKHDALQHAFGGAKKAPRLHTPVSWGFLLSRVDEITSALGKTPHSQSVRESSGSYRRRDSRDLGGA